MTMTFPDHHFETPQKHEPFTISQIANPDRCQRCHSAIWTLISESGFRVRLDCQLLTIAQQIQFLGNRPTYRIWPTRDQFEVASRTLLQIIATKGQGMILVAHNCAESEFSANWSDYFPQPIRPTNPEEVPF